MGKDFNTISRMNNSKNMDLVIVCVTPMTDREFFEQSALGKSLSQFPLQIVPKVILFSQNDKKYGKVEGLGHLYNQALKNPNIYDFEIVAFVHDDVYIRDWNLIYHLKNGLSRYDVLGIVGSKNVIPGQCGWVHDISPKNIKKVVGVKGLDFSGTCRHVSMNGIDAAPDWFGIPGMECDVLDGLFLATKPSIIKNTGLRFDSRFDFHCYDIDFCYTAKNLNLSLGTWYIAVDHDCESKGYTDDWFENSYKLKEKWLGKDKSKWFSQENRYIFEE